MRRVLAAIAGVCLALAGLGGLYFCTHYLVLSFTGEHRAARVVVYLAFALPAGVVGYGLLVVSVRLFRTAARYARTHDHPRTY